MDFANDGYEPIWGFPNPSIGVPEAVMATPTGPAHPTIEVEEPTTSDDIAKVWTPETPRPEQLCDPCVIPEDGNEVGATLATLIPYLASGLITFTVAFAATWLNRVKGRNERGTVRYNLAKAGLMALNAWPPYLAHRTLEWYHRRHGGSCRGSYNLDTLDPPPGAPQMVTYSGDQGLEVVRPTSPIDQHSDDESFKSFGKEGTK